MTYRFCPGCGVKFKPEGPFPLFGPIRLGVPVTAPGNRGLHCFECRSTFPIGDKDAEESYAYYAGIKSTADRKDDIYRKAAKKVYRQWVDAVAEEYRVVADSKLTDRIAELREKYNKDFVVKPTAVGLARRLHQAQTVINELLDMLDKYREEYSRERYYEGKRKSALRGKLSEARDEIERLINMKADEYMVWRTNMRRDREAEKHKGDRTWRI